MRPSVLDLMAKSPKLKNSQPSEEGAPVGCVRLEGWPESELVAILRDEIQSARADWISPQRL
jgi:hypothetical protein